MRYGVLMMECGAQKNYYTLNNKVTLLGWTHSYQKTKHFLKKSRHNHNC